MQSCLHGVVSHEVDKPHAGQADVACACMPAATTDSTAGEFAPATPNTHGTEARADVIGNPVVVNPPPTRQENGAMFGTP